MAWGVGECQSRFRLHDHRLRCDATGPKDWDFPWCHGDGITEIRSLEVTNAQGCRVAHVDWSAVDGWEATGDLHGADDVMRWERTHTDDHGTMKDASGFAWAMGDEHRHVHAQFDVSYAIPASMRGCSKVKLHPKENQRDRPANRP